MASRILTAAVKVPRLRSCHTKNILQFLRSSKGQSRLFSTTSMMAGGHMKLSVHDEVGLITFDSTGKVNSLDIEMMEDTAKAMRSYMADPSIKAIVFNSAKADCFMAGADIEMLKACGSSEELENLSKRAHGVLAELENSRKPVVTAIMGLCLGGGLEMAMASHYRIAAATKKTQLGLPEVSLGLLPGAGGTQRLVDLVSLDQAMDMMLTGRSIDAFKAKRIGLVDRVVAPLGPGVHDPEEGTLLYLEQVAIETARNLANGKLKKVPRKKGIAEVAMDYMVRFDVGRNFFFKKVEDKVMKTTKGVYPAPLKIIQVVKESLQKGKLAGYQLESKAFGELGATTESKGLLGLYDGMTACKKNRFGKPGAPVRRLAVVGAGLMGAGIAQVSVDKHLPTVLKDVTAQGLAKGQQQVEKGLADKVKKRKLTQPESDRISSNLIPTLTYKELRDVDMVIEAVFEDVKIKHDVIREIEQHVPPHCIVATNTSAISIAKIAEASKRPEKVIGMHYFSPVDKMMLLELVTFDKTSQDTIASAVDVGLKQGKVVITVKDSPGFYTTRCLTVLAAEAFELLLEGMDPKELDKRTNLIGFPVGSATLLDEVGVDVAAHINEYLSVAIGDRLGMRKEEGDILRDMVAKGYLGRKTGKGIFIYERSSSSSSSPSKDRQVNQGFRDLIVPYTKQPKSPLTHENVRLRILGRFTNQCILCLEEGVLASPLEGDIGAVFGLGFPPFLGGPFRFADMYGPDKLVEQLRRLEQLHGPRFKPCQLLLDHAASGKKFHAEVATAAAAKAGKSKVH